MMVRQLLECLVLPPCSALLLLLFGTLLGRFWPRFGRSVQVLGVLWLWAASTPALAGLLLRSLQDSEALPATGVLPKADAIVILAAEADLEGNEYGGPVIGPMTMQRVRYGAALARRTQLPVLVSGGKPSSDAPPLADLMQKALEEEFNVPVRWREDKSADTWENAKFSAEQLKSANKKHILLVTSAWHERRAATSFRKQGIEVTEAPTAFRATAIDGPMSFLPHWGALKDTSLALHELLGAVWYRLRHG